MKMLRVLFFVTTMVAVILGEQQRCSAAEKAANDPLIIFSSNRGGSWAIWSVLPDGSGLSQISKPAKEEQDVDPAFNSDGSRVLWTATRGGKAGRGGRARDGSDVKRVCDGDQGGWSPDSKSIVLRRGGELGTRELASGKEKVVSESNIPFKSKEGEKKFVKIK